MDEVGTDAEAVTQNWHRIRLKLREELGDATFDSWLKPLDVVSVGDGCVTMAVPTKFMREWVERNYADRLRHHWSECDPSVRTVEILLKGGAMPPINPEQRYAATGRFDQSAPSHAPSGSHARQAQPPAREQALATGPVPATRQALSPAHTSAQSPGMYGAGDASASANLGASANTRGHGAAAAGHVRSPAGAHAPAPKVAAHMRGTGLEEDVDGPIEEKNSFESFVVGKSNELAHAAARRVAESDTVPFNPLFLHGGTGLGKTHLMHAIAQEVRQRYPEKRVIYLSAEKFMYQFVAAIRHHNQFAFKKQFRTVDLLMIDDFQYISGKGNTQEEFFHTFNTLVDHSRQIVISADRSPSDLEGVEERIRSRLSWGLVADIHPTDFELRLGILQTKIRQAADIYGDIHMPQSVLEFLAHKISSNIRELEGALHRLLAHAALVGRAVDVDVAQEVLRPLIRANSRKVTVEEIQRKVAEFFGLKVADLHSPRRARNIARPRQIAMYLAKQLTTRSLPDIGRRFGNRDHTTVMHAVRKIEELRCTDPAIDEAVDNLRRVLET